MASLFLGRQWNVWPGQPLAELKPLLWLCSLILGRQVLLQLLQVKSAPGSVGADAALWCLHFSLPLFFSPPCASLNARIDSLSSATAICGDCFSYLYLLSRWENNKYIIVSIHLISTNVLRHGHANACQSCGKHVEMYCLNNRYQTASSQL